MPETKRVQKLNVQDSEFMQPAYLDNANRLPLDGLINRILNKNATIGEIRKNDSTFRNLTAHQIQCLELILRSEKSTLTELARYLKITKPSMTMMIDRLESRGLVRKTKSDVDRRSAYIHLTLEGERAARFHSDVYKDFAKRLAQNLSKQERDLLVGLLNKALTDL